MNEKIFELNQISKVFKEGLNEVKVLLNFNLSIMNNESIAIIGQSGSGKSSLLHILGALDPPTSGSIKFKGQLLNELSSNQKASLRNEEFGFVYQFHHLLPEYNSLENVAMPLFINAKYNKEDSLELSRDLLFQVGLEKRLFHIPGELSGGERQRVAVARALINKPSCLIMDEPTGDLDKYNSEKILDLIMSLSDQNSMSLVIATHDHNLANRLDRIISLDE
tara:strand:- start:734 stop:1399 length:666 start_codon:yes stop_codon:yes gene_type:complete